MNFSDSISDNIEDDVFASREHIIVMKLVWGNVLNHILRPRN
jgi:hypothetical protein